MTLLGLGLLKTGASALRNVVATTLPRAGTYYVSVSELCGRGRFTRANRVTLESSVLAWRTFTQQ